MHFHDGCLKVDCTFTDCAWTVARLRATPGETVPEGPDASVVER
jgi:hypothetical protein